MVVFYSIVQVFVYYFPGEFTDVLMDEKVVLIIGPEPPWEVDRLGDGKVYIRFQCRENTIN